MITLGLTQELEHRGISRREFMGFCASMAAVLGLPDYAGPAIAAAVETEAKPILVWLEFQDCAGNTESFLRAEPSDGRRSHPRFDLPQLPRDFDGGRRQSGRRRARRKPSAIHAGKYIALVEGSIPDRRRRRLLHDRRSGRRWISPARSAEAPPATIAVGTCAIFGGHSGGAPNPTGALVRRRRGPRRQEPDQHVGLPGQCREPHRAARLLPDAQAVAAARPVPPAALRLRQVDPRQLRAARAFRRRPVRRGLGRRGAPPWPLPLQDGLQGAGDLAELPGRRLERGAPTGRSAAGIRASAAPSRTSGTR